MVRVEEDRLRIGERFSVSFHRTLRIPEDGRTYPLPPGLGRFPISQVAEFADRVPPEWREHGGVFIPMYQREALWLGFEGTAWKPNAVQIGIGRINAISGLSWHDQLSAAPQNYLVCPPQPWLDGINAGEGFIRQFVAMPLGLGYTVEGQLAREEEFGGIQIRVFEPKPGRFPDAPPPREPRTGPMLAAALAPEAAMGLGAGGKMEQKIYPDPYGLASWDMANYGCALVHIVNSEQYRELTGRVPPPTPISAKTYTDYGFPWFDLYDEAQGDVTAPERLRTIKTVGEIDAERGNARHQADEASVDVDPSQVKHLPPSDTGLA
ncbi:MAG: hypothetical protein ACRERE_12160 [Candidatus Entotheonellia bacterium]